MSSHNTESVAVKVMSINGIAGATPRMNAGVENLMHGRKDRNSPCSVSGRHWKKSFNAFKNPEKESSFDDRDRMNCW